MTPDSLVAAARALLGMPFRHQARYASGYVDCAGTVVHVAETHGLTYFDQQDYPRRPGGGRLEQALDSQPCLRRVALAALAAGDVVLFRFDGEPQHLGICAGPTIIHAFESSGRVVEHDLTDLWQRRIVRVYRFQEAA